MLSVKSWNSLRAKASRGTVLIIVLGVLTILAVMGTAFARFMRTELQASKFFELRKKAEQLAHDGITFATAKLAEVAADRHYSTTSGASAAWTYEHDANGVPNYSPPPNPGGYGYTLLEDSTDVSFAHPTPPAGVPAGTISDFRPGTKSTLMEDGDVFKLKVIECQAQVNVRWLSNAPFAVFRDTLWDLGVAISYRYSGTWFGANPFLQDADNVVNGEQVLSSLWAEIDPDAIANPPGNMSYAEREFYSKEYFLDTLRNVHQNNNMPDDLWELAQDFVTATSWPLTDAYSSETNQVWENREGPVVNGNDEDYYWTRDGVQNDAATFPGLKEMYNLRRVSMPPINVNSAPREVLTCLFNRMQGEREYKDVQNRDWVVDPIHGIPDVVRPADTARDMGGGEGKHRGNALGAFANDAVLKFVQIGPFRPANDGNYAAPPKHSVELLVQLLLEERAKRPFTSWNDFDMRFISRLDHPRNGGYTQPFPGDGSPIGLAALPDPQIPFDNGSLGLIGLITGGNLKANAFTQPDWETFWYDSCRQLLRAALQPAPKVTKFNPDEAYWQPIDALDVQFRFAPVCFHSMGIFEVTSLGEIRGPVYNPQTGAYDVAPVASSKVRAVVKVMDIMRHATQEDFLTGFTTVNGVDPSRTVASCVGLTSRGCVTFPNSVDEGTPRGQHGYRWTSSFWERMGADGVPPSRDFGYVQIRPSDHSPYQLNYYTDVLGMRLRASWGGRLGTMFSHHFNGGGLDFAGIQGIRVPTHMNDWAWLQQRNSRFFTANGHRPTPGVPDGVAGFTDIYPDGIHLWGRGRERDLAEYGRQWAPRYHRIIAGDRNRFGGGGEGDRVNVPYYLGTIEFWCKFQDDWYGTHNSVRAAPGPGPDKNLANRNAPQRNSYMADNYFCGLIGATSFRDRANDKAVGMQMFIYKDVGMQLKIVRLLFAQAFSGQIDGNGNVRGQINDLGDINAEIDGNNAGWDVFPRDDAGVAQNPNDAGPLFARMDCIVFLDSLPFPILPHHWYHFSISWDSNDDPLNPAPNGNYQSEPFLVAVNGFQCRYAQELIVPDGILQAGVNDGHEYDDNGNPMKAHAAVILNELNPEDRLTIGSIERLMLPHSHYQALGVNPQLFQFANHDPNNDPDKPFRLVAPAEATIDTVRTNGAKLAQNYWTAVGAGARPNAGPFYQYGRYVQGAYFRRNTSWVTPNGFANRTLNHMFPNLSYPNDGDGYYYENGFVNGYSTPVRPAWISWTEYRPKWDPSRHLGPNTGTPGVPHSTLGGNRGVLQGGGAGGTQIAAGYEPPRSNIAMNESDYVQIFAGVGRRSGNAWATLNRNTLLNSETYHTTPQFTADPYPRGGPTGRSLRNDNREIDPNKKLFIPADDTKDNLTWYGGMAWPRQVNGQPLVVNPNETLLYRAYFRRGEAFLPNANHPYPLGSPHNTTAVLDEVMIAIATPPRYLEYTVLN